MLTIFSFLTARDFLTYFEYPGASNSEASESGYFLFLTIVRFETLDEGFFETPDVEKMFDQKLIFSSPISASSISEA